MRIAIATDIYLPQLSGIADSIDSLANELRKAGHAVRIYAPRVAAADDLVDVRRLPAWSLPGSAGGVQLVLPFGIVADMRAFRPDVIHVHMFGAVGWAGVYAGRRLGMPVVGTDHTFPADYLHYLHLGFPPLPAVAKKFAAIFYNRCRMVTAPSRSMLDELKAFGLRSPGTVISNPIRTGLFRPLPDRDGLKAKLGIGPEAVILFGRIAAEKNLDFAIDVFAEVSRRRAAQLVVIGDGPYRAGLEKLLGERKMLPRVRFLGELHGEPLNQAINACDVYLITSKSETQSMTMLQAAAAGLPVVAIRAGGLPEYVVDGLTGYLVDEADRDRFVEVVLTLLRDRAVARVVGARGSEFAERFAPPKIAAAFAAIYGEAVAAAKAARGSRPSAASDSGARPRSTSA